MCIQIDGLCRFGSNKTDGFATKKTELTVLDVMINNSIGIYASINFDNMNWDVTQKESTILKLKVKESFQSARI